MMRPRRSRSSPRRLTIVPANEASWDDLTAIFGTKDAGQCQCQRFKVIGWIWRDSTLDGRTRHVECTDAATTSASRDNCRAHGTAGNVVLDFPGDWLRP